MVIKYEYFITEDTHNEEGYLTIQSWLNGYGDRGWELVSRKKNEFIFKRLKETNAWIKPTTISWYFDNSGDNNG